MFGLFGRSTRLMALWRAGITSSSTGTGTGSWVACYGPRDLITGEFDLYWIAVNSNVHRSGIGRRLLTATEEAVCKAGGRMLIAETSGTAHYEPTRKFYLGMGYTQEATIKDFYSEGDDLVIFSKRFQKYVCLAAAGFCFPATQPLNKAEITFWCYSALLSGNIL